MRSNAGLALLLAALLTVLLSALPAAPARNAPLPCAGGRYLVARNALAGGDTASLDAISVDRSSVAISVGCSAVTPHVDAVEGGTRVSASWPSCTDLLDRKGRPARTKLVKGFIAAPACDVLTGTLVVNKARPRRRRFTAALSRCGDGYLDAGNGEECGEGDAGCGPGARCGSACTCEPTAPTTTIPPSHPTSTVTTTTSTSTTIIVATTTTSTTRATTSTATSTTRTTSTATSTTTTSTTAAPPTTVVTTSTTTTTSTLPGGFTCTEILGFSQTLQWYDTSGFQQQTVDARWQARLRAGGDVDVWADPNADAWTAPVQAACTGLVVLCSPCASGSQAPDRVLFTITLQAYESDVQVWAQKIRAAIATIRLKHPEVRQIVLQPVIGGPQHMVCPAAGQPLGVRASYNHPFVAQAIAQVVGDSPDLVAGLSPVVQSCGDYADDVGHLVPAAQGPLGMQIGQYYGP